MDCSDDDDDDDDGVSYCIDDKKNHCKILALCLSHKVVETFCNMRFCKVNWIRSMLRNQSTIDFYCVN